MRIFELVGALLIGGLIGSAMTVALVSAPGADAGDWLVFAGALLGVVTTILGTLWLDYYRSQTSERKKRATVTSSLEEIATALEAAKQPRGEENIYTARPARIAAEEALLNVFDKFTYARHYVPTEDIECWQAIEALWTGIVREKPLVERESQILRDAGENENVFGINIEKMAQVAERLEPSLQAALREIRE